MSVRDAVPESHLSAVEQNAPMESLVNSKTDSAAISPLMQDLRRDFAHLKERVNRWLELLPQVEQDSLKLRSMCEAALNDPQHYVDALMNNTVEKVPGPREIPPFPDHILLDQYELMLGIEDTDTDLNAPLMIVKQSCADPSNPTAEGSEFACPKPVLASKASIHQMVEEKLKDVREKLSKYANLDELRRKAVRIRLTAPPPPRPNEDHADYSLPSRSLNKGSRPNNRLSMVHFTKTKVSGGAYAHTHLDSHIQMPDSDEDTVDGHLPNSRGGTYLTRRQRRQHQRKRLCDVSDTAKHRPEYQRLMELTQRRLRQRIRQHQRLQKRKPTLCSDAIHHGFQCDRCSMEPILGTRWSCEDCPDGRRVDLCQACAYQGFSTLSGHDETHWLTPINRAETYWNPEMEPLEPLGGVYSYLNC